MGDLTRADLFRVRQAEGALRPGPWTPALTMRLTGIEREWVCMARRVLPGLVTQLLALMRSEQRLRRRVEQLEAELATYRQGAAA